MIFIPCVKGFIWPSTYRLLLIMKLVFLLTFALVLQSVANGNAQNINLNAKGQSLHQIMTEIQDQKGYSFFFRGNRIASTRITVAVENAALETAMEKILANQGLDWKLKDETIIITRRNKTTLAETILPAQPTMRQQVVTGTITDETGVPLAGVTITVKGTSVATDSDAQGNYKLALPDGASVLLFTNVGLLTEEVMLEGRSLINVSMRMAMSDLDEVVVVGYSTRKARYLSSSVTTISSEDLKDVTSNDLSTMLQGKAPGVVVSSASGAPASAPQVLIRGAATISASTAPLVVVDGNIGGTYNPADIESVAILKDAAATGLYGSRAANGVIIINTKRGKAGETKVEFNNSFGFGNPTTGNFKLMNSQQLYDFQTTFYDRDPSVLNHDTDWWGLAFGTGYVNNHNLSVSGGTEKVQYYASGVFYRENGTLRGTGHTGYNFRANLDAKLSDRLTLAVLINGLVNNNRLENSNTMYNAYTNLPFDPAYDNDGSPVDARFHPNWMGRENENFLHSLLYNYNKDRSFAVSGDLNLDYTLTDKITISSYNRTQFANGQTATFFDRQTKQGGANGGELYNGTSNSNRLLTSNRIRYADTFGAHELALLAAAEAETTISNWSETSGKGLPAGRDVMSVATEVLQSPRGAREQVGFRKYLAQADYSYDNRYFVVASFVNEFSSKFGRNNPTANFYQLGGSWIVSNESFWTSNSSLTFAKIRGSYGTVGNADGISNFAALGLYSITQDASYSGLPGAAPSQKGNPDLSWEKIRSANLGIDLTLWNRIGISADIYNKQASELLYMRPLAATTGYSYVWVNAGSVRNRGLEFSITSDNIRNNELLWQTSLNMAFNRNEVMELSDGSTIFNPGARQPIAVGYDMDAYNLPIWAGVDPENGDPLWEKVVIDANGNQSIETTNAYSEAATADSRQFSGTSAAPKFTGGLGNTLKYKNLTLSAFFNFVYGNYVYNNTRVYFDNDGLYEAFNSMVLPKGWTRWQQAGDNATHPKPIVGGNKDSNQSSSRYLEDGSYIRLRNIRLGYDLPQHLINPLRISRLQVFVSGDNLWTATKFSGPDPEVTLSQIDLASGLSSFKYPISKKVLFGINLTF